MNARLASNTYKSIGSTGSWYTESQRTASSAERTTTGTSVRAKRERKSVANVAPTALAVAVLAVAHSEDDVTCVDPDPHPLLLQYVPVRREKSNSCCPAAASAARNNYKAFASKPRSTATQQRH